MQKKIRIIFILIIPFLFVQMYYCYHYPEPFPAIMMPRFGHQQMENNSISYMDVNLVLIDSNGEKTNINRHDLLEDMHLPQRFFAVKKVFHLDSSTDKDVEFMEWLQKRIKKMTGIERGELQAIWHKVYLTKDNMEGETENIGIKIFDLK